MSCTDAFHECFFLPFSQVTDLYKEIKQTLAECLFCLACQQPLKKADTQRLLAHLRMDQGLGADLTVDPVSLCLLMTMLACFDVSPLEQEEVGRFLRQRDSMGFGIFEFNLRYSDFLCPRGVQEDSLGEILSVYRTCHLELTAFLCQACHVALLF